MRNDGLARAVLAAASGEVDALETFYDATAGTAYDLALRLTGAGPLAEALLRDSYRSALVRAGELDDTSYSVHAWFAAVVRERWSERGDGAGGDTGLGDSAGGR